MWCKQVFIVGTITKHIARHRHAHAHTTYYAKQTEVMTETLTHHALDNYIRLYVLRVCVCLCACLCVHVCLSVFFCSHALSCRCQSSPVQWKTERNTLNHAVPLKRPRLHHGPAWCVIAGFVIAFQSLFSHYLITTQTVWWEDGVLSWGPFIIIAFKNLSYSVVPHLFTSFLIWPPRPSPLFISPISASYSPLFPSLSPHSSVSGWKVQWGCGIPEGQWGFASYQSTVCVQIRVFLLASQISQQWRVTAWWCLFRVRKVQNMSWIVIFKRFSTFRMKLCILWSRKHPFVVTFLDLNYWTPWTVLPSLPIHCCSPLQDRERR